MGRSCDTLEETTSLELLSELSARLLCRNRARAAAAKYAAEATKGTAPDPTIQTASHCLLPSYFRHSSETSEGEGTSNLWVSKVFLRALPAAPEGTTLCIRFSLSATSINDDEPVHDLSLKVLQIAPHVAGGHKFAFSFGFADLTSDSASEFTLDEAQRDKLSVLQAMLGLSTSKWTPTGMLGFLLAGSGCASLDDNACFAMVVRAAKAAHRDELLARAGSLF